LQSKSGRQTSAARVQNFPLFPEKPPELTRVLPEEDEADSIFRRTTVLVINRSWRLVIRTPLRYSLARVLLRADFMDAAMMPQILPWRNIKNDGFFHFGSLQIEFHLL
jgi:hypothetical protein